MDGEFRPMHFYQNAKYLKFFSPTYWSRFKIDTINNKLEYFDELFDNRNNFIEEYDINKKYGKKTKLINDYLEFLKEKKIVLDHVEVFQDKNKNFIIINSPYGKDCEIEGFQKIYKLYSDDVQTFVKKITKDEIKNEMGKKNKSQKEMMKKFYNCHKETKECEICHGSYQYFNKYHHIKTERHKKFVKLIENKQE